MRSLQSFVFLLCLLLADVPGLFAGNNATFDDNAEQALLNMINDTRAAQDLPRLEFDARLRDTARFHATFVQQAGQIGYEFPSEPKIHARMAMVNVLEDQAGENVAVSSVADLAGAHVRLMAGQVAHSNIMTTRYTNIGVGVLKDGDKYYIVEDFARVLTAESVPEVEQEVGQALNTARASHKTAPLKLVARPSLREVACKMASRNKIDPNAAPVMNNVSTDVNGSNAGISHVDEMATFAVTFTTFHPNEPPDDIVKNGYEPRYNAASVGACFQKTDSYPQGTYWVTVVMYHQQNMR